MDLTEEFQKHAADCEQMANVTRDVASKAEWRDLARRFRQCAEKSVSPPSRMSNASSPP